MVDLWISSIEQDRQLAQSRDNFTQEFDPLTDGLSQLNRQASNVAARPRQTCDQTVANRITCRREDDRDRSRCSLYREDIGVTAGHNDVDREADELGRNLASARNEAVRPAILDLDAPAIDPTKFPEPPRKSSAPWAVGCF